MEAAADDLERRVEAAVEVAKISERGMKEATEEAKVKAAAAKPLPKPPIPYLTLGPRPHLLPPLFPRPCSWGILIPQIVL